MPFGIDRDRWRTSETPCTSAMHTSARRCARCTREIRVFFAYRRLTAVSRTARDGVDGSRGLSSENEIRNNASRVAIDNVIAGPLAYGCACGPLGSQCHRKIFLTSISPRKKVPEERASIFENVTTDNKEAIIARSIEIHLEAAIILHFLPGTRKC